MTKKVIDDLDEGTVLDFLARARTRMEVAKEFGLKRTSAYDLLDRLELKRLVTRYRDHCGKPGRPVVRWKVSWGDE